MIIRIDKTTALKIDLVINLMASHGILAAARFLGKNEIPLDVSLRILGQTQGEKRKVISSASR